MWNCRKENYKHAEAHVEHTSDLPRAVVPAILMQGEWLSPRFPLLRRMPKGHSSTLERTNDAEADIPAFRIMRWGSLLGEIPLKLCLLLAVKGRPTLPEATKHH